MSKIKLVTLDLDNTLWDVDKIIIKAEQSLVAWLHEHVPESGAIYESDALNDIRQQVFSQHEKRSHDLSYMRTQVLCEVMRRAGLSETEARKQATSAFDVFFEGRNRVELFPGAKDMLEDLSTHYRVYALTNGNANIEKAGVAAYFSGAYSSADVGNKKPHPDMFHAPLQALDLDATQAVHIGDHLIDDIQGASSVGMHSIWVNFTKLGLPDNHQSPTAEAEHLSQVIGLVADISSA